jgi:hypothetical protein
MAEILTTNFKSDTNRLFVDDILNTNYYLFVSSISTFDPEDSQFSQNEFLEKTLFAKKIANEDIHFMIKYYPWQRGQVYTQYDDRVNLDGTNFYAVVGPTSNDTGDYRVYKCLFNNYGAPVESPPNYNSTTANQIYRTADGYVWKYMYVITERDFEAYNALGFIPLPNDVTINPTPVYGSSISDIVVENPDDNTGYIIESGSVVGTPSSSGEIVVDPSTTFSPILNYYSDQSIYLTNPNGDTFLYTIIDYTFSTSTGNALVRVNGNPGPVSQGGDGVAANATVRIFPRIEILGDGSGATAIPTFVNNSIKSIVVLNEGSGYTNISIRVVDPLFDFNPEDPATTDVRVQVRGVLSPRGGHGYDLIDELKCKYFSLYAYITTEDNNNIGATNTYSAVGIVKNPVFTVGSPPSLFDNRIRIETNDIDRVVANGVITQINSDNEITFSSIIHEVDESSNTFYLAEYMGPYTNFANTTLTTSTPLNLTYDAGTSTWTIPLRNETGQTIQINSFDLSDYVQRSGRVYFMEDFFPLPRTNLSREEFKFVLEF